MTRGLLIGTVLSLTIVTAAAAAGHGSAGRSLLAPQLYGSLDGTGRSVLGRPTWESSPTLPRNPPTYDRLYPESRKLSASVIHRSAP
jgi:hypothetical protein